MEKYLCNVATLSCIIVQQLKNTVKCNIDNKEYGNIRVMKLLTMSITLRLEPQISGKQQQNRQHICYVRYSK